jgi:hypothetical protein
VSDYLERDEDYEPVTLPSPAELLHWGEVETSPDGTLGPPVVNEGTIPAVPPPVTEPEEEPTRFVARARPGRYVVAAVVTAGAFAGIAWGAAWMGGASGAKGIGAYFAAIGAIAVGIVVVVSVWRWAGRRRSGIPSRQYRPPISNGEQGSE